MSSTRDPARAARVLACFSFASAALVALLLLVVPTYSGVAAVASSDGYSAERTFSARLLETNGPSVLFLLLIPAAVAASTLIPVRNGPLRFLTFAGATSLLGFFVFLTGFSIGLFYLPTAALMAFATGNALDAYHRTPRR